MKLNTIVNRYLFREITLPFTITLVFFTALFLMAQTFTISKLIVLYRIGLLDVFRMLFYATPYVLKFILPMAVMMAILLMFLRLSSDNEIIALKTGGMSIYRMLPPVILYCFIGFLITLLMTLYGTHWARASMRALTMKVATTNLNVGLKERTFNSRFKEVMLYVNKIDYKTKELIDVFIEDRRKENIVSIVVAPKGMLYSEFDKQTFHLKLYNGTINQVGLDDRTINTISFESYDLSLDLRGAAQKEKKRKRKDLNEMNLSELQAYIDKKIVKKDFDDNFYRAKMEFNIRFAIPFACFSLGILAVPLGLSLRSAKRSYGLGVGLVLFLVYYLLLSIGLAFGEYGKYPPFIGIWLPNVLMGGLGLYLLQKAATEQPFEIGSLLFGLKRRFVFRKDGAAPVTASQKGSAAPHEPVTNDEDGAIKDEVWPFRRSKKSDVFHRSDCKWLKRMNPDGMIKYKNREDPLQEGWLPCKTCRP